MSEHKILSHSDFKNYNITNLTQSIIRSNKKQKVRTFNPIKAAYGDKFYRLKKGMNN